MRSIIIILKHPAAGAFASCPPCSPTLPTARARPLTAHLTLAGRRRGDAASPGRDRLHCRRAAAKCCAAAGDANRWRCWSAKRCSHCALVEAQCVEVVPHDRPREASPSSIAPRRQPQLRQDGAVQPAHRRAAEGGQLRRRDRPSAKVGLARLLRNGQANSVIDLPGVYSLTPATPDRGRSREVIEGRRAGEDAPDAIVAVVDATNLRMNLRLVLGIERLGRPMMVALNMADVVPRGRAWRSTSRACPRRSGCQSSKPWRCAARARRVARPARKPRTRCRACLRARRAAARRARAAEAEGLAGRGAPHSGTAAPTAGRIRRFPPPRIDAIAMHPVFGLVILATLLFLVFQAVFSWAAVPMDAIRGGLNIVGTWSARTMADGPLRSLIVDGVIATASAACWSSCRRS